MNVAARAHQLKRDWLDWPFFDESHRAFAGGLDRFVASGALAAIRQQPGVNSSQVVTNQLLDPIAGSGVQGRQDFAVVMQGLLGASFLIIAIQPFHVHEEFPEPSDHVEQPLRPRCLCNRQMKLIVVAKAIIDRRMVNSFGLRDQSIELGEVHKTKNPASVRRGARS